MKKTDLEMIEDTGRSIAQQWLGTAIENSEGVDQLNTQIHTLHYASLHMIATNIFNLMSQKDNTKSLMTLIMETKEEIESEYELIKKNIEENNEPS